MFVDRGIGLSVLIITVGQGIFGLIAFSKIFEGPTGSCVIAGHSFLIAAEVDAGVAPGSGISTILIGFLINITTLAAHIFVIPVFLCTLLSCGCCMG